MLSADFFSLSVLAGAAIIVVLLVLLSRSKLSEQQAENLQALQQGLQQAGQELREQVGFALEQNTQYIHQRLADLGQNTQEQLKSMNQNVEKHLQKGLEKTHVTFTQVVERLATIDKAQQEITRLSQNVVSLQNLLTDKRSRGAFGEVQLAQLIQNVLPQQHFALQHTLSNGCRCDCILFLPAPTGHIVIDAKFPLETYQRLQSAEDSEKTSLNKQFKQDIMKHLKDIREKYIIPNETSDGAMMFVPAEAVFASIHANYPEIIAESQRSHVWIVSPTTVMAILTTARAALKDAATQKQVHLIQKHLGLLAKDFQRFQKRMDNLYRHLEQARQDAEETQISAQKITNRFGAIERVELEGAESENETEALGG